MFSKCPSFIINHHRNIKTYCNNMETNSLFLKYTHHEYFIKGTFSLPFPTINPGPKITSNDLSSKSHAVTNNE